MPPAPVRTPSKRSVAALPETSRLSFLLAAAQLLANSVPQASSHLGTQALKVGLYSLSFSHGTFYNTLVVCSGQMPSSLLCQRGQWHNCAGNVGPTVPQATLQLSRLRAPSAVESHKLQSTCRAGALSTWHSIKSRHQWFIDMYLVFVCRHTEQKIAAVCPCQASLVTV